MDPAITKATLDRYYSEMPSHLDGEEGGTTVLSAGCVLIASLMAGTRSPDAISTLTGLPIEFVAAVWIVSESGGHDSSLRFAELSLAVRNPSLDVDEVEEILGELLLEICKNMEPQWWRILKNLRAGYVYGGQLQPCADETELEPAVIH